MNSHKVYRKHHSSYSAYPQLQSHSNFFCGHLWPHFLLFCTCIFAKALRCISTSSWDPFFFLTILCIFSGLLTYALPRWFSFLSVTNVTKLEHLHQAAARRHYRLPLVFSYNLSPFRRIFSSPNTSTRFALSSHERALCLPTSFLTSGSARLRMKPRLSRSSWRIFGSTHPLMRCPSSSETLSPLALPLLLGIHLQRGAHSTPILSVDSPLSRQGVGLSHLDSLPPHDHVIWTDGRVPISFGKRGSGVHANCFLCSAEATLSYSAGPVCSRFSAEA